MLHCERTVDETSDGRCDARTSPKPNFRPSRAMRSNNPAERLHRSTRSAVDGRPIAFAQCGHDRPRGQHGHATLMPLHRGAVAMVTPWHQVIVADEMGPGMEQNHHALRQTPQRRLEADLAALPGHPFSVELPINGLDVNKAAVGDGIARQPGRLEFVVPGRPARPARPMSRRQRGCLVQEEELRIGTRSHDRAALAPELEPAADPRLVRPACLAQRSGSGIVKDPSVPHQGPACVARDDVAGRGHAVL